jgi:hypothetical protein
MTQTAIQFIHLEAHSMKKGSKRQTVHDVISEAARVEGFCPHIETPRPPIIIDGISLQALRKRHDFMLSRARLTTTKGVSRKIREDQLTMLSCIVSCPITPKQAASDPDAKAAVKLLRKLALEFLQNKFGGQLTTVVVHVDEAYIHFHGYILPNNTSMSAARIHPGLRAKSELQASLLAKGMSRADSNRVGNRAYCDAMRTFQDDYAAEVGIPCGQARLGPQRMRYTRSEWNARQRDAKTLAAKEQNLIEREQILAEKERLILEKERNISEIQADNQNDNSFFGIDPLGTD